MKLSIFLQAIPVINDFGQEKGFNHFFGQISYPRGIANGTGPTALRDLDDVQNHVSSIRSAWIHFTGLPGRSCD
jgi:hypothetical protein